MGRVLIFRTLRLGDRGLPTEVDLAAPLVDAEGLDNDLLAFVQLVGGIGHAVVCDLAAMQEAVQAGEDGDEGTVLLEHLGNLAQVDLADSNSLDEVADHLKGNCQFLLGVVGDLAEAVAVDVHFAAADFR